jgi:hypothetical protein
MLIRQKTDGDCGIAALVLLTEQPYDRAAAAVAAVIEATRNVDRDGLLNRHVLAAAEALGAPLTPQRVFDLDRDEGILRLYLKHGSSPSGHFVAVRRGLILCPTDGMPSDWRHYQVRFEVRFGTLLRRRRR